MRAKNKSTLLQAYSIAAEYNGNLTVRQLYYQLVARGFIQNSQESYRRLVCILTDGRLSGDFPFEWLLDRTREARPGRFSIDQTSVEDALASSAREIRQAPQRWLWRDRWYGQPYHVSVWVEKEALAGVFEDPCEELGVSWFVLRGYSSLSALSQWVDNVSEAYSRSYSINEAVVLYFGDHDPDGWEIPRSAERNIQSIADVRGIDLPLVTFRRVALLYDQIERYDPPPFPAKESSSRFESYVAEHGLRDAWELDALRPEVLEQLIRENVDYYFDEEVYQANENQVSIVREKMKEEMRQPDWLQGVLA